MRAAGLGGRAIPGEALLFRLFNTVGETLPSMALARQAVLLAKGKSRTAVQDGGGNGGRAAGGAGAAARRAAVRRAPRRRSDCWSMATTTPYDMVKPLADLLGLDDVVATAYTVSDDGTYDGSSTGRSCGAPAS